jgi:hypothetical protein
VRVPSRSGQCERQLARNKHKISFIGERMSVLRGPRRRERSIGLAAPISRVKFLGWSVSMQTEPGCNMKNMFVDY